jgi:thymidine phosphorylase
LSNLVCIISSRGIDTNEGTLDILKMIAQYSVYL